MHQFQPGRTHKIQLQQQTEFKDMVTVTNSTPNADISTKHENRFFLIKFKIFYIWTLNFPHVY